MNLMQLTVPEFGLEVGDRWSGTYYVQDSREEKDRGMFVGTS